MDGFNRIIPTRGPRDGGYMAKVVADRVTDPAAQLASLEAEGDDFVYNRVVWRLGFNPLEATS